MCVMEEGGIGSYFGYSRKDFFLWKVIIELNVEWWIYQHAFFSPLWSSLTGFHKAINSNILSSNPIMQVLLAFHAVQETLKSRLEHHSSKDFKNIYLFGCAGP